MAIPGKKERKQTQEIICSDPTNCKNVGLPVSLNSHKKATGLPHAKRRSTIKETLRGRFETTEKQGPKNMSDKDRFSH